MYHVIIIEDDPMVASINKQYVEVTPLFKVDQVFKNGMEALEYFKENAGRFDYTGLLYSIHERRCLH